MAAAKKAKARVEVIEDVIFGLDLDLPEDLDYLHQLEKTSENPTKQLLEEK